MKSIHYKNRPSLKAANVVVPYTEFQVQEYIKCSKDPIYFIENYVKIVSLDKGIVPFKLYPYQTRAIDAINDNNRVVLKQFRQSGKAVTLDTLIAAGDGLVPMRDIHKGSQVYGPDGKICTVTAVTEPFEANMYKITFDDKSEVICCEDHQWSVVDRHNKRIKINNKYAPATLVMTAKELYNSKWSRVNNRGYTEYAYYIPNTIPVRYPTKQQLIEPYLLGVWLGDGTSADTSITTHIDHVNFLKEQGIELLYRKSSDNKVAKTERVKGLSLEDLRRYNLIRNKHIPYNYLFGDVEQRINLLQGLMDTDGFISKDTGSCHIQLGKHNMRLLDDIYILLCSLGLKVTKMDFSKTNSIRYSFSCPRSQFDVFRIPHKLERQRLTNPCLKYINSRTIQNIEPLNEKMLGKCIQVDNESNSYLCTNSFIPTHNSQIIAGYVAWYVQFNEHKTAAILANKQPTATEIFNRVQFIIEGLPIWLQQGVVEWNKTSLKLENGTTCFSAATSPSAIRGRSCVVGDTKIQVLNCDDQVHITEIKNCLNRPLKAILTKSGFKTFDGIIDQGIRETIRIITSNTFLECTLDHKVMMVSGDYSKAGNLKIGDVLYPFQPIIDIISTGKQQVYDALNVADTHSYITNNLISHNCSLLALDEFAHMLPNLADEFIKSVFPTISSSETAKMIIMSTPNGLNHYRKLWVDAVEGRNGFIPIEGNWRENPDRNQAWADRMLRELGPIGYAQEIDCEFNGSSYTLINGHKLVSIPFQNPIVDQDNLQIFKKPEKLHSYVISVDVSRGVHQDFSAFSVIDVSQMPYEVVAVYKDNTISTMEFPHLIYNMARQYNDAYLLIEVNDLGEEVSNTIWYDYEYEYLYFSKNNKLSAKGYPGIRTTTKVKSVGCSTLKELVEKDQLILNSHKIIEELGIFVLHKRSYAANDTSINDDLCTTLFLFAWLTSQSEFQEIINISLRDVLTKNKQNYIDQTMTPYMFFDDGMFHLTQQKDNTRLPSKGYHELSSDQMELLMS